MKLCFLPVLIAVLLAPFPAHAESDVTVFAAASLKDVLEEIAEVFEERGSADVTLSFAGSSALARQIDAGAPADIFVSASEGWMDWLAAGDMIEDGSRTVLAANQLVLIMSGMDAETETKQRVSLAAMISDKKLAMAFYDAVPAGIYGKQALMNLGAWDDLKSNVVQTDNVRSALKLVALGEISFGIVYATDVQGEEDVSIVLTFPSHSHSRISYPAARITGRENESADQFMAFLKGAEAAEIFSRNRFKPASGEN